MYVLESISYIQVARYKRHILTLIAL